MSDLCSSREQHCMYLSNDPNLIFPSSQAAVRPPVQKAKSPAPQAPGGSSAPKLGPKGMFGGWLPCAHLRTYVFECYTRQSFTSFSPNCPCSPAASGFPVAKATSIFACSTAFQTDEGKQWAFFCIFVTTACCSLIDATAAVRLFVGHGRSSTAPQTCQGTGPHDHRCQVWPTCWYHQGYKYIFKCKIITYKTMQSEFVSKKLSQELLNVKCVNTKCDRNRRWKQKMVCNWNTFVLLIIVLSSLCLCERVYLHIFSLIPHLSHMTVFHFASLWFKIIASYNPRISLWLRPTV